jgi:hypothetical protein
MIMKKQQIQQQIQTSAYDRKVTYDMLYMTLEWLEKYIEVAYGSYYPDWQSRKQIHDNRIKRTDIDGNPKMAEDTLSTQLLLFRSTLEDSSPFLREEVKQEFYRWIDAFGIDANNCPERLKNFLFGIDELLEGRGDKVLRDAEKRQPTEVSPEQMTSLFAYTQAPAREEAEVKKSLKGKTHRDINIETRFSNGDGERGRQTLQQIASSVAGSHQNFHFFPQKEQQQAQTQQPPYKWNWDK